MSIQQVALEAIAHLQGSCEALYVEYEAYEDNDEFLGIIDDNIFNCVQCGWWYPTSERSSYDGEWVCEECYPEDADD